MAGADSQHTALFCLTVEGVTVLSSGGDGIYMAGVVGGHFADLTLDNHYRQGKLTRYSS